VKNHDECSIKDVEDGRLSAFGIQHFASNPSLSGAC
jgi:hypothetical protein